MKKYTLPTALLFSMLLFSHPGYSDEKAATPTFRDITGLPNTDITLFDLSVEDGHYRIANPKTVANSPNFDSQPAFTNDGTAIFFMAMVDGNGDLFRWDMESGKTTQITETPEGEYSPTVLPFDQSSLSTVRVEMDGTQRLWKRAADGSFSLLFKTIKPVGYHAWSDKNIALFVLGEPHRLEVTKLGQETTGVIAEGIGRCLQKVPGRNAVSYTQLNDTVATLNRYDFDSHKTTSLFTLPKDHEDYVWHSENSVIGSDGKQLLVRSTALNDTWQTVENRSGLTLTGISRLTVSPDRKKIAVVHLIDE